MRIFASSPWVLKQVFGFFGQSGQIVSLVGGGGKTTLMYFMAATCAKEGKKVLVTTTTNLFGMEKGRCYVLVDTLNFECGTGLKPAVSALKYGVYDPDSRLRGSLCWHKPWGAQEFPSVCGENFKITKFS